MLCKKLKPTRNKGHIYGRLESVRLGKCTIIPAHHKVPQGCACVAPAELTRKLLYGVSHTKFQCRQAKLDVILIAKHTDIQQPEDCTNNYIDCIDCTQIDNVPVLACSMGKSIMEQDTEWATTATAITQAAEGVTFSRALRATHQAIALIALEIMLATVTVVTRRTALAPAARAVWRGLSLRTAVKGRRRNLGLPSWKRLSRKATFSVARTMWTLWKAVGMSSGSRVAKERLVYHSK